MLQIIENSIVTTLDTNLKDLLAYYAFGKKERERYRAKSLKAYHANKVKIEHESDKIEPKSGPSHPANPTSDSLLSGIPA